MTLRPVTFELQALADEHRQWLSAFDPQYLANWEKLLNADDESAMTEASVRRMLEYYGVSVEPNEDLTGSQQSLDFRCFVNCSKFYVEVTRISIDKATQKTGISQEPSGFTPFQSLNNAIFQACIGKAKQCSSADAPVLLAIGTWHSFAAMASFQKPWLNMLLTGKTGMTWNIDTATGEQVGETFQSTELHSATFLKPDSSEEIGLARSSISGLILFGAGLSPPKVMGVLHPNPTHPFDPSTFPKIEFGHVTIEKPTKTLHVSWVGRNEP